MAEHTEFDQLSEVDRAVMRAMSDEWQPASQVAAEAGLSQRVVLGRLRSLRSRGLATFRPSKATARESGFGDWALTSEGDRITWGVS